jgi:hypothetical protein
MTALWDRVIENPGLEYLLVNVIRDSEDFREGVYDFFGQHTPGDDYFSGDLRLHFNNFMRKLRAFLIPSEKIVTCTISIYSILQRSLDFINVKHYVHHLHWRLVFEKLLRGNPGIHVRYIFKEDIIATDHQKKFMEFALGKINIDVTDTFNLLSYPMQPADIKYAIKTLATIKCLDNNFLTNIPNEIMFIIYWYLDLSHLMRLSRTIPI